MALVILIRRLCVLSLFVGALFLLLGQEHFTHVIWGLLIFSIFGAICSFFNVQVGIIIRKLDDE